MNASTGRLAIQAFFDEQSSTVTYVLHDRRTLDAAIVDPVLGFDSASARTDTVQADKIVAYVHENGLKPRWILETHAHADHLTSAAYLRERVGGRVAIGDAIGEVQDIFAKVFNFKGAACPNGAAFDHLLRDNEVLEVGGLRITALRVPGHTPADMAFLVDDAVFVGDTLFMPDVGTARADFPGGSAGGLYRSIRKLLDLPCGTRMFVCHDYPPSTRPVAWETTVAQQRAANIHVRDGVTEDAFVAMRTARDQTLAMPKLLLPAIQVNVCAGRFPAPEDNGVSYLKIPLQHGGLKSSASPPAAG